MAHVIQRYNAGGLDERLNPEAGAADKIENMSFTRAGWAACPGDSLALSTAARVHSIGWFSRHVGIPHLLIETGSSSAGGTLYEVIWGSGASPALKTVDSSRKILDTPWSRTRFLSVNQWVWYCNSYNRLKRYNGTRVVPVGFDRAPPPPTVHGGVQGPVFFDQAYGTAAAPFPAGPSVLTDDKNMQRGVGTRSTSTGTPRWRYGWCVTWVNDLGQESPPSEPVWLSGSNRSLVIPEVAGARLGTALELAAPPAEVYAMRIYRTVNVYGVDLSGGALPPMYLVAEVEPVMSSMYFDEHPDEELGEQLLVDELGPIPQRVRLMASYNGRTYVTVAGDHRLYYSSLRGVEQFPSGNFFTLGNKETGEPRFLHATRNSLLVGTSRGIFIVVETDTGPRLQTLTEQFGSAAADAVDVPGAGVMFLSKTGPFLIKGSAQAGEPTSIEPMGDLIQRTWARVNCDALVGATVTVHRRKREIWWHVPAAGAVRPSLGLVYHWKVGVWSTRESWDIGCMLETGDERADLFYGSAAGLYHVSDGYTQSRTVRWKSAPIALSDNQISTDAAMALVMATGKHTLHVDTYSNRNATSDGQESIYALDPNQGTPIYEGPPVWNDAVWSDTKKFADLVPARVRVDVRRPGASAEVAVQFEGVDLVLASFGFKVNTAPGQAQPQIPGGNR